MTSIGRFLGLAAAALLGLVRLWYRAVLVTPAVKRRKALRRARRRG